MIPAVLYFKDAGFSEQLCDIFFYYLSSMIQEGKSILKNWWYGAHILHKDKILHIFIDARQGHSGMIILGEKVNSCLSVLQGFLFLAMLRIYQKTLPGMVQH